METEGGVVSCDFHGVVLHWHESLVRGRPTITNTAVAIAEIERQMARKEIDDFGLRGLLPSIKGTDLRCLGIDFFVDRPGSAHLGKTKLEEVKYEGQILHLELKSPTGEFRGSVWIEMKTYAVVRAIRDGKEVTPD